MRIFYNLWAVGIIKICIYFICRYFQIVRAHTRFGDLYSEKTLKKVYTKKDYYENQRCVAGRKCIHCAHYLTYLTDVTLPTLWQKFGDTKSFWRHFVQIFTYVKKVSKGDYTLKITKRNFDDKNKYFFYLVSKISGAFYANL